MIVETHIQSLPYFQPMRSKHIPGPEVKEIDVDGNGWPSYVVFLPRSVGIGCEADTVSQLQSLACSMLVSASGSDSWCSSLLSDSAMQESNLTMKHMRDRATSR